MMREARIVEHSRQDQIDLISACIDAFLPLSPEEEKVFEAELAKLPRDRREAIMAITTSWMEKGIRQGKRDLLLRQLRKRVGTLGAESADRIGQLSVEHLDDLGEALLDFSSVQDLTAWLDLHASQ